MARNDGIDRTVARNQDLETPADVAKVQEHNEREKDSYSNQDIVPERTALNVHFKSPTDDYVKMFEQMEQDGVISTRGLKPDAVKYGELIFDVNSAYFYNHGGYEFAKQFYALNKIMEKMGLLIHYGNGWGTTDAGAKFSMWHKGVLNSDSWHPELVDEIAKFLKK